MKALGSVASGTSAYAKAKADAEAAQAAADLAQSFGSLRDGLGDLVSRANDAGQAARQLASTWQGARDSLSKASTALLISDQSLSPSDLYRNTRTQFDALRSSAYGGSSAAANDIATFASQFLQSSFQYNGSTTAYGADLSYVKDTLSGLGNFSESQRSLAQRQADSMDAAVEHLQAINDAIRDQSENTTAELEALRAQVAELSAEIKQANLQARVA
jgi:hypothetical protein